MKTYKSNKDLQIGWPELTIPTNQLFQHDGAKKLAYKTKSTQLAFEDLQRYMGYGWFVPAKATAQELTTLEGVVEEEIHTLDMEIAPAPGAEEIEIAEMVVVEEEVYEEVIQDQAGTEEDIDMELPAGCDIEIAPNPTTIREVAPKKVAKTAPVAPKPVKTVEPVAVDDGGDDEGEAEVIALEEDTLAPGITIKSSDDNGGSEEVISFEDITPAGEAPKSKPASQRKITKQPRPTR